MAASSTELRPRSMAELMDAAIHLYRSHFSSFLLIALIVNLPLMVIGFLDDASALEGLIAIREASTYDPSNPTFTSQAILVVIASLVTSVFIPWMDGALAHQTLERVLGRHPTWRESYRATRPYWGALWLSMFIKGLAFVGVFMGLGLCSSVTAAVFGGGGFIVTLLLSLAPGLFLALNWVFSPHAVVFENATATGALTRSSALMRGSRGMMLVRVGGFGLIWLLFAVVLPFAFSVFVGRMGLGEPDVYAAPLAVLRAIVPSLLNALALLLVGPMFGIYVTLNYLDLRIRKDNLDLQLRAQALAPHTPVAATEPPAASATPVDDPILAALQRISTEGESAELLNELGRAYQAAGELDSARDVFERARRLEGEGRPPVRHNAAPNSQ